MLSTQPGDCREGDTEPDLVRARGSGEGARGGEADLRASLDISCRILEAVGRHERGARGAGGRWGRG